MSIKTSDIVKIANKLYKKYQTRDAYKLAKEIDITIIEYPFKKQRGAYKVINKQRFIFLKEDLCPEMKQIVIFHEIGHDILHRHEATKTSVFTEFEIFDMACNRMEYEANIFASQIALDEQEFIEYIMNGYDTQQIACAMNSDINLVALKADTLISQGYKFVKQEHKSDFLKFDK